MIRTPVLAAALLALAAPALAQTPAAPQTLAPEAAPAAYALPQTEVWDMTAAHGPTYRLYVSRPAGDPPEGGFPVLYVLDGNALFGAFAEGRRLQTVYEQGLHKFIIVGIGYPGGELYDVRRLADFTPPTADPVPAPQRRLAHLESGRRDDFLAFLMDRVRPEIARRYSVDPEQQSLFGHSLGGLFALHVLYARPRDFHAIVAVSSTVWWNDQAIVAEEADFARRLAADPSLGRGARLLLLVGEREEAPVTVGDNIALARRLEALSAHGLRSAFRVYDDETHMTAPLRAIPETFRFISQWP